MDIKPLTPALSVSPQIMPEEVRAVHDAGFRSIICNRPDGESDDQPEFATIAKAARDLGMPAVYQPVIPGQITAEDVAAFGKALTDLPGPVLAFCRTGTRSANLWSQLNDQNATAG